MTALTTSLPGRVQNTSLPKVHSLLPLFEAVVNSIQSIQMLGSDTAMDGHRIKVTVVRRPQEPLLRDDKTASSAEPIVGFDIEDNGVGFTPENLQSFLTLDSDFKAEMGSKGVGRLLWLKAFERVRVESVYTEELESLKFVEFDFSLPGGVSDLHVRDADPGALPCTRVSLSGWKDEYRDNAPKTVTLIARGILEHCLWHFVAPGGAPDIVVIDQDEEVSLAALFEEYAQRETSNDSFMVKGQRFDLIHVRIRGALSNSHTLHWCASTRMVHSEGLRGKISGLFKWIEDEVSGFVYVGFLTSDLLDQQVRADRTAFDIPESHSGTLMESEISMEDIRREALSKVSTHLAEPLNKALDKGVEKARDYIDYQAPHYKPMLRHVEQARLAVDPAANNRDVELHLHKIQREFELELKAEGAEVLKNAEHWGDQTFQDALAAYLAKVSDLKEGDLAKYVVGRRVILQLLEQIIGWDENRQYSREDALHSLIMPLNATSEDLVAGQSNLWLIDERLAFHEYLASDKPLSSSPNLDATSHQRPDILGIQAYDTPALVSDVRHPPLASIVVVEIKRPMRNDARTDNPIDQALGYLDKVREGKVRTRSGRPIPESASIPGYCYILADLTTSMIRACRLAGLRAMADKMGYFGFNEEYGAYIEVISLSLLLRRANERNQAFFAKLGLPD